MHLYRIMIINILIILCKNYLNTQFIWSYSLEFSIIWKNYKNLNSLLFSDESFYAMYWSDILLYAMYRDIHNISGRWVIYAKPRHNLLGHYWDVSVIGTQLITTFWDVSKFSPKFKKFLWFKRELGYDIIRS